MLPSSEHAVNREFLDSQTKKTVNKLDYVYGIVLISLACCSFRCTLPLYSQCVYLHSVTAAKSELNEARVAQTPEQPKAIN